MKKTLLITGVLILGGFVFGAFPATAQNWYGHVGTTFYWDDSKTTLVGTRVVSSCVGNAYHYLDGQTTSNVTHDMQPCNANGMATFVQIAPYGIGMGITCSYNVYLLVTGPEGPHWEFLYTVSGPCANQP